MKIWYFTPCSDRKNLAEAYNLYGSLVKNPDDWIVFQDRDIMYMTPDYFEIIKETIEKNPDYRLFTCMTNRVGNLVQCHDALISENPDLLHHEGIATLRAKENRHEVKSTHLVISGMWMAIQKKTWDRIGGAGTRPGLLGVDNYISRKIIACGMKIGVMQGLYVLHYYRLRTGRLDKSHLKLA